MHSQHNTNHKQIKNYYWYLRWGKQSDNYFFYAEYLTKFYGIPWTPPHIFYVWILLEKVKYTLHRKKVKHIHWKFLQFEQTFFHFHHSILYCNTFCNLIQEDFGCFHLLLKCTHIYFPFLYFHLWNFTVVIVVCIYNILMSCNTSVKCM